MACHGRGGIPAAPKRDAEPMEAAMDEDVELPPEVETDLEEPEPVGWLEDGDLDLIDGM